ncbi:hypothetical protein D3C80_2178460 [compost metagenome]
MEHAHSTQARLAKQRIVQVHGSATRQEEHMPDALVGDELEDVVGDTHEVVTRR